ncbi:O-antigen ligase family protein [Marinicauda pacifica]|uniref:O-antigen ligase family protein n=1 Tax=Marinicauda pacifica TaxID=1133559 RepID=UPI0035C86713
MSAARLAERWRSQTPVLTGLPVIEGAVAVVLLFLFSQALLGPLLADPADPEGAPILRLIWPPVYALTLVLMLSRPGASLRYLAYGWPVLALAALTVLSTAWSLDPALTLRRSFAIFMTTLFGIWLAAAFSWRDLLRVLGALFALLAVMSFVAGLAVPGFGIMQEIHPGAWKGLWWEKNTLGALMAWALLVFVSAGAIDPRYAWVWRALAPLALLLVLLSTSKTALLASLVALGSPLAIALVRRDFTFAAVTLVTAALGLAAGVIALIIGPAAILEALGRDPSLTGRIPIWAGLIDVIGQAPWTGFGYGAFWAAEDGPVHWLRKATEWDVPTAHNAWIETALALGLPGLVLGAFVFLRALGQGVLRLLSGNETYFALTFMMTWGLISVSESNMLQQNSLVWVLLVTVATKLAAPRDQACEAP